jgi:gas vesicle protein
MMKDNRGAGRFVTFAVGLGVGTVAALLFAPKAGEDLRDEIAEGATDRMNQARSAVRKIGKRTQAFVDQANNQINDAVEAGESAYNNAKKA